MALLCVFQVRQWVNVGGRDCVEFPVVNKEPNSSIRIGLQGDSRTPWTGTGDDTKAEHAIKFIAQGLFMTGTDMIVGLLKGSSVTHAYVMRSFQKRR